MHILRGMGTFEISHQINIIQDVDYMDIVMEARNILHHMLEITIVLS